MSASPSKRFTALRGRSVWDLLGSFDHALRSRVTVPIPTAMSLLPSPMLVSRFMSSKDVPERCMDVRMRIRAVASEVKLNIYAICDLTWGSCRVL